MAYIVGTRGSDTLYGTSWQDEIYGDDGADRLSGGGSDDWLQGDGGNDTILGGDGNDYIIGGWGADSLDGGNGNDIFLVWEGGAGEVIRGGAGVDVVQIDYDSAFNRLILDSAASVETLDMVYALNGTAGNDTFNFSHVTRIIDNQTIWMEGGNDSFYGSNIGEAVMGGTGNDTLIGNGGADQLIGGTGADSLDGGSGNDTFLIWEGTGDTFYGGSGTDVVEIDYDSAIGWLDLDRGAAIEVLDMHYALNGTGGADTYDFTGIVEIDGNRLIDMEGGNDRFTGSAEAETVDGGAGNDVLRGMAGDDWLFGGTGRDVLTGGAGFDVFAYDTVAEIGKGTTADRIADFTSGVDLIDLSIIDANTGRSGNQSFSFIGDRAFSGVAGQLRFDDEVVSGDVNGDRVADFALTLTGVTNIYANDFVL